VVWLAACASAALGQDVEGKKIVGGHGYAMPTTYHLREYAVELKRAPLDGIMVHVNRNDFAGDEKLREVRPLRWFISNYLKRSNLPIPIRRDLYEGATDGQTETQGGAASHDLGGQ
jgi:hypothetical protein